MRNTQPVQGFLLRFRIGALAVPLLTAGYAYGAAADPTEPGPPAQLETTAKHSASQDRLLFPHNWARGYTDFQFAPPRNEPDLGRCYSSTGEFGGVNAPCANYARYVFGGYLELRPFGRTPLRRLFFFTEPKLFLGNTVPQLSYGYSLTPIAYENLVGAGIELPRNLEFRVVNHGVHWLGRYQNFLGPADVQSGGPYGSYATVGVRWYFGGYGREHGAP